MIRFFRWLFTRKPKEVDRGIFKFHDGKQVRAVDPIQVIQKLRDHPTYNPSKHHVLIDHGDTKALEITCDAICVAFDVTRFDGKTGLTVAELMALLITFNDYLEFVKKNIKRGPILPSILESTSSQSPTTNDSSRSISQETEQPTEALAPSSSA